MSTPADFIKPKKSKPGSKLIESEKTLEANLGRHIKALGGWSVKLFPTVIGLPDRIILAPGAKIFFAEIKTTGRKPTKIQNAIHEKIRSFGFKVYVIDSTESLKKTIKTEFEC